MDTHAVNFKPPTEAPADDDRLQDDLLAAVSRTFALTIPQLPGPLARVAGNAYLLCRIVDTIEDETVLEAAGKREFYARFVRAVEGKEDPRRWADALMPLLCETASDDERALVRAVPRVIRIMHGFTPAQRVAISECIRVMTSGMAEFQERKSLRGLKDLSEHARYCYYVAGVVGEMLTRLFCDYSRDIARNGEALMARAVSFGQGLQMTNILKDVWEDRQKGACWLPRDVFIEYGCDLSRLEPGHYHAGFGRGLDQLIAEARGCLKEALEYTLLIPREEEGIRNFCLWAIGMAVLTLRKLHRHPDFSEGRQVKITRRSVAATIAVSRFSARRDRLLRQLFGALNAGLPRARVPTGAGLSNGS
ncbi:MAG: squalene/phytoene synthase family protein [Gammaproteobacteria bacterium]|nr:squalene/phytoene synthase family protein [Gammaproteobacteria bacterium]